MNFIDWFDVASKGWISHDDIVGGEQYDRDMCDRYSSCDDFVKEWSACCGRANCILPFQRIEVQPPQQTENGILRLLVSSVNYKHRLFLAWTLRFACQAGAVNKCDPVAIAEYGSKTGNVGERYPSGLVVLSSAF
jgi:hypothetical protein